MSNSSRCAACKSLRRRCAKDCVLAPYFPSNDTQRFSHVHKVYGASNITKMLQQLPEQVRAAAADCMSYEASARVIDPVYGCVKTIHQLQQQIIDTQNEILKTNCEIALYKSQHQFQIPPQESGIGDDIINLQTQLPDIAPTTSQQPNNHQRYTF